MNYRFTLSNARHYLIFLIVMFLLSNQTNAQSGVVFGKVSSNSIPLEFATISILSLSKGVLTDSLGNYIVSNLAPGSYKISVSMIGYTKTEKTVIVNTNEKLAVDFDIQPNSSNLNEVVVTGTLKEVSRLQSPVAVEVYTPIFLKKNPTPTIYEALQNINGVRPQLNCNVCNTGDIHINGMEGPYTMILIDGMPIVSSLATVYGLSGIPNAIIERIEIVKGPASSLYGSEAVGGLINVITKKPSTSPKLAVEVFNTSWQELNADIGITLTAGKKASVLTGINYFNFQNKVDRNKDNFTDMTLQHRVSVFQKWNFERNKKRLFTLAGRYMYEDRWGGDLRWNKSFRGGSEIYAENIYTSRYEVFGNYQLPTEKKLKLSFSYNSHDQNSVYGTTIYEALQNIAFTQLTYDKQLGKHNLLLGTAIRYTFYDDNTPATASPDVLKPQNLAQKTWLPGIFLQDEIAVNPKHKLLLGIRYDYNSYHGNIFTPRLAYKLTINPKNTIRLNMGTGYRVVNLFTEDHAALTDARKVEIINELKPERSINVNFNYVKKFFLTSGSFIGLDASAFYTFYNNRIIGNYDMDPNKIIYNNLTGFAQSKGLSLNTDFAFANGMKILLGATLMANTITENNITKQQILTEKFTSVWAFSYKINKLNLAVDYTGNVYSPMRLPLLGTLDPRKPNSPWWSIQNIQLLYSGLKNIEFFGGVKNLLNWTPAKKNAFVIARTNDPFDKEVQFGPNGQIIPTPNNPNALSFDPTYVYAPMQGIRVFLGFRYNLK